VILILARHGNTFRSDESAYYVGSQNDLPLVEKGLAQAQEMGQALSGHAENLVAVYTGPLQRMQATAKYALEAMDSPLQPVIDTRLNELDYGLWSGLTSREVREKFGDSDYEAWERQSLWPAQGAWGESEPEVIARIQAFAADLAQRYAAEDNVLVVASNGCLRYFLHLVPHAFEQKMSQGQLKIATGHLCQLQYEAGAWSVDYWNQSPKDIAS